MTCERSCAPRRWPLTNLPVGQVGVTTRYAATQCPNCRHAAAWVQGVLRCLACGHEHVLDRSAVVVVVGGRALVRGPLVAFEKLPGAGRERAGNA